MLNYIPKSPVLNAYLHDHGEKKEIFSNLVCSICSNAMWSEGKNGLDCFCQMKCLTVWTSKEPTSIWFCDGSFDDSE